MSPHVLPDGSHLDTYEQVASGAGAARGLWRPCSPFELSQLTSSLLSLVQGVLFSSFCLERNLQDMMHLWGEIFNR